METTQLSVVLYKQKLAHLEQEKSQGEISEEVYHQTRAELEKSLLTETGADLHAKKIGSVYYHSLRRSHRLHKIFCR